MKVHIHATGQYSLNGTADEFLAIASRMQATWAEIVDHREKMGHADDSRHQVDFVLPEVDGLWDERGVVDNISARIVSPAKAKQKPTKAKAKKKVRR